MRSKNAGELLGFAKITRDMTERKTAQERLLQQQHALLVTAERLKQADIAKTLFLQKLSHELRAPLNPVTLILSSFLDKFKCNKHMKLSTKSLQQQINGGGPTDVSPTANSETD